MSMKRFKIFVEDNEYSVTVERLGMGRYRVRLGDRVAEVSVEEETPRITSVSRDVKPVSRGVKPATPTTTPTIPATPTALKPEQKVAVSGAVTAMLPGVVLKILVSPGDAVKAGQPIMVLEAMKMENEIVSPVDGVVHEIRVKEGDKVETGDLLAVIQ
jgi:oxaloacetate decarboxylase alpha subunit